MAQQIEKIGEENMMVTQDKTKTTFILKAKQSRLGTKSRQNLLPEIQDQCKNEPMVQTTDFIIDETDFDKYIAGELITVKSKTRTRRCETFRRCSTKGPRACGYGWTNPDQYAPVKGFSFHQVSDESICVQCNIYFPGEGFCAASGPDGFCMCEDIRNKKDLMDCSNYNYIRSSIYIHIDSFFST